MPESLPPDYETNNEFLKAAHHAMLEVCNFLKNVFTQPYPRAFPCEHHLEGAGYETLGWNEAILLQALSTCMDSQVGGRTSTLAALVSYIFALLAMCRKTKATSGDRLNYVMAI